MLEIVALYFLCKWMGEMLRAKGWKKPIWMQVAVVLSWFGAMFIGCMCYGAYVAITEGPEAAENLGMTLYPIALLSALSGVGIVFLIAKLLPPRAREAEGTTAQN